MPEAILIETDPRAPAAVACLTAYYGELSRRFAQGFDVDLSRDPQADEMIRPRGVFLLAEVGSAALGCVGLKTLAPGVGEVKRLWVAPQARGLGLARRLMQRLEDSARELGLSTLRLDTNSALPEAAALYRATGWAEIARYNDDPYPDMFFEKALSPSRA